MKKHVGELLVEAGIITVKTLERALKRQQGTGKRLGIIFEEMGVITQEELMQAIARQFDLKTVTDIAAHSFPHTLLDLVPEDMAVQKLVFPLKKQGGVLALAVNDPFDVDTIDFLAKKTALKIVPVLATRNEILAAIRKHYLKGVAAAQEKAQTVLVVDDSPSVTAIIESALKKEGYHVITASDGVEGLKLAFSTIPNLIICDAVMPRMDGFALMRAIKANPATQEIPMILLTSKASPEEEHRALKSGFHDFIAKPVMTVRVVSRVKRAFEIMQRMSRAPETPAAQEG
ncbi:response regulator [Geomonas sp. RF6]|uniref:response regulator n=1 Tax=Geomonas sp. RF6 TaxID=2897342 RepID=UPI001E28FEA2|nr:response regulator [Geomonas sp. RF6]UFS69242.1 response regulator [Geomonas sp. RF6]